MHTVVHVGSGRNLIKNRGYFTGKTFRRDNEIGYTVYPFNFYTKATYLSMILYYTKAVYIISALPVT